MKNEENFMENLVAPALKLFSNKIVQRRNGPQRNWRRRKLQRRNALFPLNHPCLLTSTSAAKNYDG